MCVCDTISNRPAAGNPRGRSLRPRRHLAIPGRRTGCWRSQRTLALWGSRTFLSGVGVNCSCRILERRPWPPPSQARPHIPRPTTGSTHQREQFTGRCRGPNAGDAPADDGPRHMDRADSPAAADTGPAAARGLLAGACARLNIPAWRRGRPHALHPCRRWSGCSGRCRARGEVVAPDGPARAGAARPCGDGNEFL